jgi:hypothetical protein
VKGYKIDIDNACAYTVEVDGLRDYYREIGCDVIDIVVVEIDGAHYNVVIDDEGLLRDDPRPSVACGGVGRLYGNAIVLGMDEETCDLATLTDADVTRIFSRLANVATSDENFGVRTWLVLDAD